MSTFVTPASSVAVQVMACGEFTAQNSPPFGDVTATVGPALSMATVAAVPTSDPSGSLLHSRRLTSVMVTLPGPAAALLVTARSKSVPLVDVVPHGSPNLASSMVYEPPPLSMTWKLVVPPPEGRNPPSVIPPTPPLRLSPPASWTVTENANNGVVPKR